MSARTRSLTTPESKAAWERNRTLCAEQSTARRLIAAPDYRPAKKKPSRRDLHRIAVREKAGAS